MPHSFIKLWVHAIWATKERLPLIIPSIEQDLFNYMSGQFVSNGCPVRIINGMAEHVHCLFLLNAQKSIAEVIKQIKGSTSHWLNGQNLINEKFAWQTGYAAYAVSESQVAKVFQYIKGQKGHHAKTTFSKEYDNFIKVHGLGN